MPFECEDAHPDEGAGNNAVRLPFTMECRAHGITYRELMVQLLGMYRVLGSTPRTAKTGDKSDDRHTEKNTVYVRPHTEADAADQRSSVSAEKARCPFKVWMRDVGLLARRSQLMVSVLL